MENKRIILNRMLNVIKGQAMFVREDQTITDEEKLEQADILLNIMKYVQHYDEYSQVLAEHLRKKQRILNNAKGRE